ncbi:aldehyde dehydrogenase [Streptomyces spongiae]|uniref:Aldehyde dehydrogenase n=2 Tax=Streptomyces spongiae TaxID=565072 RepID=A0A5N8XC85_9ACTN|nr:aldehyde dehydrogenase [Streptomyces spongiae]
MVTYDRPRLFIDGAWTPPRDGEPLEIRNPADQSLVGLTVLAGPADAAHAVTSARTSFDDGRWSGLTGAERARVLSRAADLLQARSAHLVALLTSELGCPRWFSERAHVPNPIRHLRYYADLVAGDDTDEERTDGVNRSLVVREPVGVVAAITPWNGPLSSPMLKIAPALAAGCSVIAKPAPEAPLTLFDLTEVLHEAGLPPGVFNVLPAGRETGERLVADAGVDKVAFTGSTAAGKRIMAVCAERIARVTLELGGKSAAILLPDADLDDFVTRILPMALLVNGQACIAQTRILVPAERHDEVVEALAAAFRAVPVGDPLAPETVVGPLISGRQRDRVEGYIAVGRAEGARVVTGGGRPVGMEAGWYVEPTLFDHVDNGMRIAREEIFGPVVAVIPYRDTDDAVAITNDSPYGLSGSVWSADPRAALAVARRLRTGMVSVNGRPQAYGSPFGGYKQSGIGREMGPEGLRAYQEIKSIAV